jgi:hypothetical protein
LKAKRLEITVEIYERVVIKQGDKRHIPCVRCRAIVQMLKPEEAAILSGVSARTIYRWIESEKLHITETPDGLLLICINSLPNAT